LLTAAASAVAAVGDAACAPGPLPPVFCSHATFAAAFAAAAVAAAVAAAAAAAVAAVAAGPSLMACMWPLVESEHCHFEVDGRHKGCTLTTIQVSGSNFGVGDIAGGRVRKQHMTPEP